MPPCPPYCTAGTLSIAVFSPCCVINQTGPTFSVISIRPSGRNARRHGSLKSATLVSVNGRSFSGSFVPALTCAHAADDVNDRTKAIVTTVFIGTFRSSPSAYRLGLGRQSQAQPLGCWTCDETKIAI